MTREIYGATYNILENNPFSDVSNLMESLKVRFLELQSLYLRDRWCSQFAR